MKAYFTRIEEIERERRKTGKRYREFLRVPAMSAGLYSLPAGGTDTQQPHHQDEIYYVIGGQGRFRAGDRETEVSAGSVLFVAAEVEHHFHDVSEELVVLVFFAPPES